MKWAGLSVADPGSGVFDPGPGSEMGKKSGSGSGMNNPNHISESIETIFGLKILYLNSWMRIRDPGWKKFGSGLNISDPQHCWSSTVKWGNVVTFLAQNHIFLRIFFR
jgi:hypothetical protein